LSTYTENGSTFFQSAGTDHQLQKTFDNPYLAHQYTSQGLQLSSTQHLTVDHLGTEPQFSDYTQDIYSGFGSIGSQFVGHSQTHEQVMPTQVLSVTAHNACRNCGQPLENTGVGDLPVQGLSPMERYERESPFAQPISFIGQSQGVGIRAVCRCHTMLSSDVASSQNPRRRP